MSLRYAILGLLSRDSLTGYDLAKRFDTTIASFWTAGHSQIYPELAAMHAEGLVLYDVHTQAGKPTRKVYTITPEGRTALASWVAEPGDRRTVKDPFLMRAWALGQVPAHSLLPQLQAALPDAEARLAMLVQAEHEVRAQSAQEAGHAWMGALMILQLDVSQTRTYVEWLRRAIAGLSEARPQPETVT